MYERSVEVDERVRAIASTSVASEVGRKPFDESKVVTGVNGE